MRFFGCCSKHTGLMFSAGLGGLVLAIGLATSSPPATVTQQGSSIPTPVSSNATLANDEALSLTTADRKLLANHNRLVSTTVAQTGKKPNIIVLWGDDIGVHNISAYNHGIMGYRTPNIDRIAKEGALFTDAYSQQSCTAGRASFILGQHPFRTGLLDRKSVV